MCSKGVKCSRRGAFQIFDPTSLPCDDPDMPIDDITGPTATTEGSTKPKKDREKDKDKDRGDKDESKTGLRGGTGAAGPLIQMPGQEKTE